MTLSLPIARRATKCFVPGAEAYYLFDETLTRMATDLSRPRKNLCTPNQATGSEGGTIEGARSRQGGVVTSSTEQAWQGTRSFKIVTPNAVVSEGAEFDLVGVDGASVLPGSTATASIYLRGSGTVAFRLYAAPSYAGSPPTVITLTDTWTRYSGTLTFPAGTTSAYCAIQTSSAQTATIYADGIQVEWGAVATPWEAPPNLASLGPFFYDNGKEPAPTAAGLVFYGQQAAVLPSLPFITDGTPYTLLFALTPAVANAYQMVFSANSATGATGDGLFVRLKDDGTAEAVQYDGDRAAASSSVPYQANVPQIICVRWDGASLQISNGAAAGTSAAVASMAPYSAALPTLGALCTDLTAQNYVGELHPTIVYPHAITDAQIAQMRSFFSGVMAQRGRPVGTLSQPYFPIVALGDSNTRSRLFDIRSAYPFILAGLAGRPVANAGIIGNKTDQMLARLPSLLAQFAPDTVTILGGANDVNTGVASATVIANLGNMVTAVTGAGATAVLLTVPPSSNFSGAKNTVLAEVNAWIATQAAANVIVVDVHAALKDPAVPTQLLAIYDSGDHIHLNAAGQQLVADTMHAAMQGA